MRRCDPFAALVVLVSCSRPSPPEEVSKPTPQPPRARQKADEPEAIDDEESEELAARADDAPSSNAGPESVSPPTVTFPDGSTPQPCGEPPPGMACIPGGPFVRGVDETGPRNAQPQAKVWLSTYYMDIHEVTYAEYRACMADKGCPRARPRYTDFDHPNMPMQGVSWFDAKAYCEAHGKALPSEAQWENAARGPDGELYPWGVEPTTCERAIIKDERGRSCGLKKAKSKPEVGRPWDVGSRPAFAHGLHDMIGNSWEWVSDWYSRSYAECGEACEGIDPLGPCDGAATCPGHRLKIVRGGSWYWGPEKATAAYRRSHFPANEPFHHFGFRCAASAEQAQALREAAQDSQN